MPRLLLTHDVPGTPPHDGLSLMLSLTELSMAFGDKTVRFVPTQPGEPASRSAMGPQHVLLEVTADETMPPIFSRPGYYLIEGVSAAAAEIALRRVGIGV